MIVAITRMKQNRWILIVDDLIQIKIRRKKCFKNGKHRFKYESEELHEYELYPHR
jgi:hypothetical protein